MAKTVSQEHEVYLNYGINRILVQLDCFDPEVISVIRSAFYEAWLECRAHTSVAIRRMKQSPILSQSADRVALVNMIENLFGAIVDQQEGLYVDAGSIFARLPIFEQS